MRVTCLPAAVGALACVLVGTSRAAAQGTLDDPLNEFALRPRGQNVIPVYDGWFENADGTYTFCFSYFNLNTKEALDVPLGPGNHIEPARFDGNQPTHFDPVPNPKLTAPYRHYWCVFTVTVPADFGKGNVVWTLATQGDTLSVPASLIPAYVLNEITSPGRYAVAPFVRLEENGASVQGKRGVRSGPRKVSVGQPLELTAWIEHPETGTWVGWTKHQGPGSVTFSATEARVDAPKGQTTTTATFDRPGHYVIRLQAINDTENPRDPTYGFEFHCCWTNGYVDVDVN
jgi:hypothetical protein